jgi:phage shock protein E
MITFEEGADLKIFLLILLAVVLGIIFSGCAAAMNKEEEKMTHSGYHRISPEEAKQQMDMEPDLVLLDVRTLEEYQERHIPGARLLPNESITDQPIAGVPFEAKLLVYCRTGRRSADAARKLLAIGYQQVYDMDGGIVKWPYATESGD